MALRASFRDDWRQHFQPSSTGSRRFNPLILPRVTRANYAAHRSHQCAYPRTFLVVRWRTTPHEPRLTAGTNLLAYSLTRQPMSEPNHCSDHPLAAPWISRFFWIAGIYGVIVVVPLYFLESRVGRDYPPPITHAEFLYAFAGVGLAWQIAFFIIATDPARYRLIMVPSAGKVLLRRSDRRPIRPGACSNSPLCIRCHRLGTRHRVPDRFRAIEDRIACISRCEPEMLSARRKTCDHAAKTLSPRMAPCRRGGQKSHLSICTQSATFDLRAGNPAI